MEGLPFFEKSRTKGLYYYRWDCQTFFRFCSCQWLIDLWFGFQDFLFFTRNIMTNMSIKDPKEALRCHTLATTHQLILGLPIVNIHLHTVVLFVSLLCVCVCVNLSVCVCLCVCVWCACVWGGGGRGTPTKFLETSHSKMTWSFLIFLERKHICPFFIGNPLWTLYIWVYPLLKASIGGGVNS